MQGRTQELGTATVYLEQRNRFRSDQASPWSHTLCRPSLLAPHFVSTCYYCGGISFRKKISGTVLIMDSRKHLPQTHSLTAHVTYIRNHPMHVAAT